MHFPVSVKIGPNTLQVWVFRFWMLNVFLNRCVCWGMKQRTSVCSLTEEKVSTAGGACLNSRVRPVPSIGQIKKKKRLALLLFIY